MYMQDQNLGFLKKIGKKLKKVVKPLAHIGAAYVTGGASLQMSAKMIGDKKAQKSAKRAAGKASQADFESLKPDFDAAAYLAQNPDVARDRNYKKNPWLHYTKRGYAEGRPFPSKTQSGSASTAAWAPQTTSVRAVLPYTPITPTVAQPASQTAKYLSPAGNSFSPSYDQGPAAAAESGAEPGSTAPPWMIPAVIGGGALLLLVFKSSKRAS